MPYVKITYKMQTIELTPEAITDIIAQVKSQASQLTLIEMAQTAGALGLPLPQLIALLKGNK